MKAHENVDESFVGEHVVGNGFDGPRAASFFETPTKPATAQANVSLASSSVPALFSCSSRRMLAS
jgi:hypothetical protein